MDFLLLADDVERTDKILGELGYSQDYKTQNVGQFSHADNRYGSVDFIYASREIAKAMLARAKPMEYDGSMTVRCLLPEDIIGLKLQALVNDPITERRDMADIEALLLARRRHNASIDWTLREEYFYSLSAVICLSN